MINPVRYVLTELNTQGSFSGETSRNSPNTLIREKPGK
jgi:hypothetical protein